ncbi:hypothetical protein ACHAP7_005989 [Fusarium lateritium]
MQNGYILLAPALYAASMYMILGRLIRACHAHHLSPIPVRRITRVFVGGDIISFTIQASGGSMAISSFSLIKISRIVVVLGLFVQVIIFGFFIYISNVVHRRLLKSPTEIVQENTIPWKRYLYILYATSGIILVRGIFRIIEYIEGNNGFFISYKAFLYIFDAMLMAVVMTIFLVCHDCQEGHPVFYSTFTAANYRGEAAGYSAEGKNLYGSFLEQLSFSELAVVKEMSIINVSKLVKTSEKDILVVTGLGGIGLVSIMTAKLKCYKIIIGVNRLPDRLQLAKSLGAAYMTNTADKSLDVRQEIQKSQVD